MPCANHPEIFDNLRRCDGCQKEFCSDCVVTLAGQTYCASCKGSAVRAIQSGKALGTVDLASIGRRFAAMFIDGLILGIPMAFLGGILGAILTGIMGGDLPQEEVKNMKQLMDSGFLGTQLVVQGIITVVVTAFSVLYEALMLAARGQTLGKIAMKIKVVTPEGKDITKKQAWGRALTRSIVGWVPLIGFFADYLPAFMTKGKTCMHDMLPKTRVVNCD